MLTDGHGTERALRRLLLDRLRPLASTLQAAPRAAGVHRHGPQLFSYCCIARERLARVSAEKPRIGIVLSGEKEFWFGGAGQHFVAGDAFVLPANVAFDVVNIPADGNGLYESLLVEIERIPPSLRGRAGPHRPAARPSLRLPLTPDLVDALSHAAILLHASDHASSLADHRLTEILMLLADVPAASALFAQSLPDRIGWLVTSDPGARWTAERLGRELGMAPSTLRRKLADQNTSLRETLMSARMSLAHDLLVSGGGVTQAAIAAGYASRSHFTRRFRQIFGQAPNAVRQGQR